VLVLISVFVAVTAATISSGFAFDLAQMVVGVVLCTLVMLLVSFISSLPFASVTDWFLAATIPLAVLSLPILFYSGVWPSPVVYLIPSQGPLLLLGSAFYQVTLAPWQVLYAVLYPLVCVVGLCWAAKSAFGRYVIERSGVL
jgi:fluoroquinolone transport system permease protein